MQRENMVRKVKGNELRCFCVFSMLMLFVAAFLFATPREVFEGMKAIVTSRDVLITDYFELAGYGAAFFNAGCMLLIAIVIIEAVKIPYTGLTLVAIFINVGYGLWGKNPVNVIPCILGTWIYAKVQKMPLARYTYTGLFATCLAPFVTDMVYHLPFPRFVNLVFAIVLGLFVGYILPPLSMHTTSMHMGYCLTNVGFAGGMLATVMYSVLKLAGIESEAVFLWKEGVHPGIAIGLAGYFVITILFGLWLEKGRIEGVRKIMRHPGRAVADFVIMDSAGTTLMNMGIMGLVAEVYILLIGGDLSGPVIGSMLTLFGLSAFGAHLRNYLPVLAGVMLATFFPTHTLTEPSLQVAALFVVAIVPIAGQFGIIAGVGAGVLHAAVVMCTSQFYGGLNLYNNGFSAGWVAIVLVPFIESFMKQFEMKRQQRNKKTKNEG
ncbi:MAG: DUF1576 domain-containing protein [Lachnospiraceae bacterium]|nr:DUF1576 domain-containing protein [Lachnospiraceae bacterium]